MTSKTIIRLGLTGFVVLVCLAFFLTSFNAATPSSATTCKESMDECCQKKTSEEAGSGVDLEMLSGKFFSTASY